MAGEHLAALAPAVDAADALERGAISTSKRSSKRRSGLPPDIDDVLYSLRGQPYTFEDLQEFLEGEFNDENILFWGNAEEYQQRFEKKRAPKVVRVADVPMQDPEAARAEIVAKFVRPGSDKEVNISSAQRDKVLQAAEGDGKNPFAEAQNEVKELMANGSFPRFLRTVTSTNISPGHAKFRKQVGAALILLGLLVTGGMIALELVELLGTPLARLANLLFFIAGFGFYISGRQKV